MPFDLLLLPLEVGKASSIKLIEDIMLELEGALENIYLNVLIFTKARRSGDLQWSYDEW